MMRLALYKGRGDLFDKAIRWWTKSRYSHCELVLPNGLFLTSSPRDGGVRAKVIVPDPAQWDFIELPGLDPREVWDSFMLELGAGYDWKGIVGSQVLHLGIESRQRWFCSELCASLIGLDHPAQYSPGHLAVVLEDTGFHLGDPPRLQLV